MWLLSATRKSRISANCVLATDTAPSFSPGISSENHGWSERRAAIDSQAELRARLGSELSAEYARWRDLSRRLELYETRILDQSHSQAQAALLAYQSDAGDFADLMRAYIDELNARLDHLRLQVDRAQHYAVLANLGGIEQ